MENENQNTITPQAGSQSGDLQAYMSERRRKRNRNILIGMVVAIFLGIAGYFAYKNPQLFGANITEVGVAPTEGYFYIPSYEGGAGENGTIAVKVSHSTVIDFDSITFSLTYNPVDALTFGADPIVFDSDTVFQSAVFKMATVPQAGKLAVTIILPSAVTANAGETLFKLNTQIASDAAAGQVITLGVQDFAVLKGVATQSLGNMVAGNITVKSLDQLKVLNAEATDSTHVVVRFSDFLQNFGNNNYYKVYINNNGSFGAALEVTNAELGSDEKSVSLTTATQIAGTSYVVVATGDVIAGNTQGKLNTDFDAALFYGYGQSSSSLSDFNMVSAAATDYKTVVVTFTDNVKASSVTAADFYLADMTNIATPQMITVSGAIVSGKTVTLTVADPAPCNTYANSSTCEAVVGCDWVRCLGTPALCSTYATSSTCSASGCTWGTACTGTPALCSTYTTSPTCGAVTGCSWASSNCTGTPTN